MNNIVPFPNINIPDNPQLSQALSQNFQQLSLNGLNIMDGTIGFSKLATTIKDTDSAMVYTGTWTWENGVTSTLTGSVGGFSGSFHNSSTTSSTVSYTYRFSNAYILAIVGPNCGQVSISVDGANTVIVDTYNANYAVQNIHTIDTTNNQHTITITLLGTKNSSSTGYNFNLVGLSNKYQITDANIAVGGVNDISIGSLDASKIIAGSIMFDVALNNGSGTFTVDKDGNMVANSATIKGSITSGSTITGATIIGGSMDIGSGTFIVSTAGNITMSAAPGSNLINLENQTGINFYSDNGTTLTGSILSDATNFFHVQANQYLSLSSQGSVELSGGGSGSTIYIGATDKIQLSSNNILEIKPAQIWLDQAVVSHTPGALTGGMIAIYNGFGTLMGYIPLYT